MFRVDAQPAMTDAVLWEPCSQENVKQQPHEPHCKKLPAGQSRRRCRFDTVSAVDAGNAGCQGIIAEYHTSLEHKATQGYELGAGGMRQRAAARVGVYALYMTVLLQGSALSR